MANKIRLLKGRPDFKYIVENNGYFVDKTLIVKEFYDSDDNILLIPRPRRFGKTLNLSVIEHFFDIRKKESTKLFTDFKISRDIEFCKKHQNQYPVINISLKSIRAIDWNSAFESIKTVVSELYKKHEYLLQSEKLQDYNKQSIEKLILEKGEYKDYMFSLKHLSGYLKTHYEKEVIILVDEYDTPIIDGYKEKYYKQIIKFMQVFLGSAFKENEYLHKGLITGIMRIARESIFSEMNNLGVFTISNHDFADKFGFTEEETKQIINHFIPNNDFRQINKWYNGYTFGLVDKIYNPWSIVSYISKYKEGFNAYWVNTGTDPLIKERITEKDAGQTRTDIEKLISGQTIEKIIDENFVFSDFETNKEMLWTLLTFSGYLTQIKKISRNRYKLKIPNYEIKTVFQDYIFDWLNVKVKIQQELLFSTSEYLITNQIQNFEKGFKKIIGDTFSYFDTEGEPEKVYQAYTLGLLAIIGDDYIIKSNRESGEGRYDILLIPHDKTKYGIVIEIKQIEKQQEKETITDFQKKINSKIQQALNQIEKNKYYKELIENKIHPDKIIKLPIIFAGKEPYIITQ